ncbi:MAG: hypothetical protein ACOCM5_07500 [Prevotella pectinovora]
MNTEELNALKDKAYKWAVEHGFHEEEKPDAYWLGLVMSEMGEAINADRKGRHADTKGVEKEIAMGFLAPSRLFESYIKDTVEDEIADIVIRLLDFAGLKGYTLSFPMFYLLDSSRVMSHFAGNGLPGTLIELIVILRYSFRRNKTERAIGGVINTISDCFEKMTGSEHDLWWFVKQKMRYNETRAMLNGKRY